MFFWALPLVCNIHIIITPVSTTSQSDIIWIMQEASANLNFRESVAAMLDCVKSPQYRQAILDVRIFGGENISPTISVIDGQPARLDELRESRIVKSLTVARHILAITVNEPYEMSIRESVKTDPLI